MSKFKEIMKTDKITLDKFKMLYNELLIMHNESYVKQNESQCIKIIELIIEVLITNDKQDIEYFELFCEYNFMNELVYLASTDNRNINLQIIKSLSILILSVSSQQTIYYIFSNNYINHILNNNYERYDHDFISYYVNFLKSLASKLDKTIIQFFYQAQFNTFPLCAATLKLYNYPDTMVKNHVRNIILNFLKLDYPPLIEHFCCLPAITYFTNISCSFRDLIIKMNNKIMNDDSNYSGLYDYHDEIITEILFFQDILSVGNIKISNILINSLFYYTILPLLCGSLISIKKPVIAISTSLYVLISLFDKIKDESFKNCLFCVLFFNKVSKKILSLIKEYPTDPTNYHNNWKDQVISNFPTYFEYLKENFSEPIVNLIALNGNPEDMSDYKEVNDIRKKVKKILKEPFDIKNKNQYGLVLREILILITKQDLDNMTNYHKTLTIATGVNVGLFLEDFKCNSFLMVLHKLLYKIKTEFDFNNNINDMINDVDGGPLKQLNLVQNEVKMNIFSYLKGKDDGLIILVLLLLNYATKNVATKLCISSGLADADLHSNSNYDTNNVLTEIFYNTLDVKEKESYDKEKMTKNFNRKKSDITSDYDLMNDVSIVYNNNNNNDDSFFPSEELLDELLNKNKNMINDVGINKIKFINENDNPEFKIDVNDFNCKYHLLKVDNPRLDDCFVSNILKDVNQRSYDVTIVDSIMNVSEF